MFKFKQLLLIAGVLASTAAAHAQIFTANITGLTYTYTGYQSGFEFVDAELDGNPFTIETGIIICIDFTKDSYWANSGYTDGQSISEELTTIENTKSWGAFGNFQNESLAIAQLGWLIDNYYEDRVIGDVDMVSTTAFANVVWEIMHDGGTAEGLDVTNGNFTRSFSGSLGTEMLEMVNAVKNSGVAESYVWGRPKWVVKDDIATNQDYLLLSNVVVVPEPSSLALISFAALFMIGKRRRA